MAGDTGGELLAILDRWAVPPPELVGKRPVDVDREGPKHECRVCGGWHRRARGHLDYLGHAATTRVLCEIDPAWSWEPVAWNDAGEPLIVQRDRTLRMWIRLTLHGVTRLGVGTCEADKADAEKELIGDALRNAAMRFGVGLSLWAREDWTADHDRPTGKHGHQADARTADEAAVREMLAELDADTAGIVKAEFVAEFGCGLSALPVERLPEAAAWVAERVAELTAPWDQEDESDES